jgi:hypothetical protein
VSADGTREVRQIGLARHLIRLMEVVRENPVSLLREHPVSLLLIFGFLVSGAWLQFVS